AAIGGLLGRLGLGLLGSLGGSILDKGLNWVRDKITTALPFTKTLFGGSNQASGKGQPVHDYTANGGMNSYEDDFRRTMQPIGRFIDQQLPQ
ncbi:hypothetical protein KDA23_05625, partial [Candidatus Saccharibacteria bacterium]|nr:hypothetical protein [Candidatus Saccharibacteria bacterium]